MWGSRCGFAALVLWPSVSAGMTLIRDMELYALRFFTHCKCLMAETIPVGTGFQNLTYHSYRVSYSSNAHHGSTDFSSNMVLAHTRLGTANR